MSRTDAIAREVLSLLGSGQQTSLFSSRFAGFDLAEAYGVIARLRRLREDRGERVVGRKIGFTNTEIWKGHGLSGPIWNYMFDTTVRELAPGNDKFDLIGLAEPRVEPEIVFVLASTPRVGMSDDELMGCIGSVAHGFELVQSIFPAWSFSAADAAAGYGMHGALLVGERRPAAADKAKWQEELAHFSIVMESDTGVRCVGSAADVLGGPVHALRFLVEEIDRYFPGEPLRSGEIITTGTLTEAKAIAPGEIWTTHLHGIGLEGLRLRLT